MRTNWRVGVLLEFVFANNNSERNMWTTYRDRISTCTLNASNYYEGKRHMAEIKMCLRQLRACALAALEHYLDGRHQAPNRIQAACLKYTRCSSYIISARRLNI